MASRRFRKYIVISATVFLLISIFFPGKSSANVPAKVGRTYLQKIIDSAPAKIFEAGQMDFISTPLGRGTNNILGSMAGLSGVGWMVSPKFNPVMIEDFRTRATIDFPFMAGTSDIFNLGWTPTNAGIYSIGQTMNNVAKELELILETSKDLAQEDLLDTYLFVLEVMGKMPEHFVEIGNSQEHIGLFSTMSLMLETIDQATHPVNRTDLWQPSIVEKLNEALKSLMIKGKNNAADSNDPRFKKLKETMLALGNQAAYAFVKFCYSKKDPEYFERMVIPYAENLIRIFERFGVISKDLAMLHRKNPAGFLDELYKKAYDKGFVGFRVGGTIAGIPEADISSIYAQDLKELLPLISGTMDFKIESVMPGALISFKKNDGGKIKGVLMENNGSSIVVKAPGLNSSISISLEEIKDGSISFSVLPDKVKWGSIVGFTTVDGISFAGKNMFSLESVATVMIMGMYQFDYAVIGIQNINPLKTRVFMNPVKKGSQIVFTDFAKASGRINRAKVKKVVKKVLVTLEILDSEGLVTAQKEVHLQDIVWINVEYILAFESNFESKSPGVIAAFEKETGLSYNLTPFSEKEHWFKEHNRALFDESQEHAEKSVASKMSTLSNKIQTDNAALNDLSNIPEGFLGEITAVAKETELYFKNRLDPTCAAAAILTAYRLQQMGYNANYAHHHAVIETVKMLFRKYKVPIGHALVYVEEPVTGQGFIISGGRVLTLEMYIERVSKDNTIFLVDLEIAINKARYITNPSIKRADLAKGMESKQFAAYSDVLAIIDGRKEFALKIDQRKF